MNMIHWTSALFLSLVLAYVAAGEDDACAVEGESRYDCGFPGITEEECIHGRSCCWNATVRNVPWCYFNQPTPCDIPENRKFECGHREIQQEACEERGCCWRESQAQIAPYCFYTRYSPETEFHSKGNNELWLYMHQTTFSFTVEACEDAIVYLSTYPRPGREAVYEILIGGAHNTRSAIFKYVDGTLLGSAVAESRNVLACNGSVSFYLSWYSGYIFLGTSSQDNDVIVEWEDATPIEVNVVRVGTLEHNGVWRFSERSGQSVLLNTREDNPRETKPDVWIEFEPGQTDVVLKLHACANAFIELTESRWTNGQNIGYEIVLGKEANTMSGLKRIGYGDNERIDVNTPEVLDCDKFQSFWISWKGGHVEVGQGQQVNVGRFMDKVFVNPDPMRFMTFYVRNIQERKVSWEFPKWKGEHYTIRTPPTVHENITFHATTHKDYFLFDLQACSDAYIYLSTDLGHYRYGVHLGDRNNISRIIQYNWPDFGQVLYERSTPDILSCGEPRHFWLSWYESRIVVGKGTVLNMHTILTFWDTKLSQMITGIGLRSGDTSHFAEWNFQSDIVDKTLSVVPNQYMYGRMWYHDPTDKQVQFRVQACEEANIALTEYAGVITGHSYEVKLGINGNTRSEIWDKGSGKLLSDVSGKVLGCNDWTPVWLKWSDSSLSVGTGDQVGANRLMYVYNAQYEVNAVGISSSSSNNGLTRWEFSKPAGEIYEIFTEKDTPEPRTKFLVYQSYFIFKVKLCEQAIISLLENPDDESHSYRVLIGEEDNSRTSIYKEAARMATSRSDAVLDCSGKRDFWVSWTDGVIRVGKNNVLGEQIISSYSDPEPKRIYAVTIASGGQKGAQWSIKQNAVASVHLNTPDQYSYNYLWKTVSSVRWVVFRVRACNDAHISLSSVASTPGLHDVSEIVLGASGNTRAVIRSSRLQDDEVSRWAIGVLNCREARYFWISWLNGLIEVGKGSTVGAEHFLKWQDPDPHPVAMVAVSTGWGTDGDWEFHSINEEVFVFITSPQSSAHLELVPSHMELRFSVRACADTKLIMLKGYDQAIAYQLVIGGEENTKVYIIREDERDWSGDQESDTPGILSCTETRGFIFRWGHGGFTLTGSDDSFHYYWFDPDFIPVYSIIANSDSGSARWSLPRSSGEFMKVSTSSEPDASAPNYDSLWIVTQEDHSKHFQVKSCGNAHILLASYAGLPGYSSYEIRLSTGVGQQSLIMETGASVACDSMTDGELLSCDEYRSFWVDWGNGFVAFGKGGKIGEQIVLQCQSTLDLTSLGFGSSKGNSAAWAFEDAKGEVYKFWTRNSYPYWSFETAWLVPNQEYFTFEVEANEWVALKLASAPWQLGNGSYEVHIGRSEGAGVQQYSSIVDIATGAELVHVPTPQLVSKGRLNSFWVGWEAGYIIVGMGHNPEQGMRIMRTDAIQHTISSISFATPRDRGYWQVPRDQIKHLDVHTKNEETLTSSFEITTRDIDRLVFQLRATNSAFLKLRVSLVSGQEKTYTLVLGGVGNTRTGLDIHPNPNTWQFAAVNDTPGILDYREKRTFWLSWSEGIIQCGKGPVVGDSLVLQYEDDDNIRITSVTLSNPRGQKTAHWTLSQVQGQTINVRTHRQHGYKKMWMALDKQDLSFRVRACSDATVLLSQTLNQDNSTTYEVVFGGYSNHILFVRRSMRTQPLAWIDLPKVVDCSRFLRFWIKWGGGNLTVGSGTKGALTLLRAYDHVPIPVVYVSVSTGWGSSGDWQISHDQAEVLHLFTGEKYGSDYQTTSVSIQGHNYVLFNVTSCEGAQVALSYIPNLVTVHTYEVTLGRNGSRGVSLRESVDGSERVIAAETESVVGCGQTATFWVWWTGEQFRVGRGMTVGEESQVLLNYSLVYSQIQFNSVQFRTPDGVPGQWVLIHTGYHQEPIRGGLSAGAVTGIVIGTLVLLAVLVVAVVFFRSVPARQRVSQVLLNVYYRKGGDDEESKSYVDPQDIIRQVMGPDSYTPDTLFSKK